MRDIYENAWPIANLQRILMFFSCIKKTWPQILTFCKFTKGNLGSMSCRCFRYRTKQPILVRKTECAFIQTWVKSLSRDEWDEILKAGLKGRLQQKFGCLYYYCGPVITVALGVTISGYLPLSRIQSERWEINLGEYIMRKIHQNERIKSSIQ